MPLFIKPEIRVIGWDDSRHTKNQKSVQLVGVIMRGGQWVDGVLTTKVKVDGVDSTETIASAIIKSRHYDQLSVIMTDGITFGGFNIVDINALSKITQKPVIAVQRRKPNMREFKNAIKKIFADHRRRLRIVEKTGRVIEFRGQKGTIYYQKAGCTKEFCERLLSLTSTRSFIPEPLRVAHLIAGGLSGESRGGA
ncbi:MAG: DUF99 family protein [Candidatus Aenigmarchaeota archaeon]|nr:DUF99 family protein [Candidatus Aenigmarchaeota archaeon]